MEIKFDNEMLKTVVSEALLKTLDADSRARLIAGAIQYLLTESKGTYGAPGRSPLQEAFESAIRIAAGQLIQKEMDENEELKAKIRGLFADVANKIFTDSRESIVAAMAKAFENGLTNSRY